MDFKTQLSNAKDSLTYLQKKIEADIDAKLIAKEKGWDELKVQIRQIKDSNDALTLQVERSTNLQNSRIDEISKKTDEMNLHMLDFATKKDLRTLEEKIQSLVDARVDSSTREITNRLTDLNRLEMTNKQELNEEIEALRKKQRDYEISQEDKDSKRLALMNDKISELQKENKRLSQIIEERLSKFNEEINTKIDTQIIKEITMIKQENTTQFNENNEIMTKFQDTLNKHESVLESHAIEREKSTKWLSDRCEKLEKEKAELDKNVNTISQNQDKMIEKVQLEIDKKISAYDKIQKEQDEKKDAEINNKLLKIDEIQGDIAISLEEYKKQLEELNKKIADHISTSKEEEHEQKIAQIIKEIEEMNQKIESVHVLLGNEDSEKKMAEFDTKLKTVEAELAKRQEMFTKYDAQMQEYEKRYQLIEAQYKESLDSLNKRCTNIEQAQEKSGKTIEEHKATIDSNSKTISNIVLNADRLDEEHVKLEKRVSELEKRLAGLRADIQQKLSECAKVLKAHRDAIQEISKRRPQIIEKSAPQKSTENVGVNVIMNEKQLSTVLVGTDNISYEVEVQTDRQEPPKLIPEEKKELAEIVETILNQDYREPQEFQSSGIFNDLGRAQSEHLSEDEKEQPNLNQLVQKTPRQVAFVESPDVGKMPSMIAKEEEPEAERNKKMSPMVNIGDMSQQTDNQQFEDSKMQRSTVSLQVPQMSRDFFGSSPHYLREDPFRSKDKKKIISTQGAKIEQNISTKHFRQAEKFNVNLDDIAKITQEEAPRQTYSDVIDYNAINFEDYKPQIEEDSQPTSMRGTSVKAFEPQENPIKTQPRKTSPPTIQIPTNKRIF